MRPRAVAMGVNEAGSQGGATGVRRGHEGGGDNSEFGIRNSETGDGSCEAEGGPSVDFEL